MYVDLLSQYDPATIVPLYFPAVTPGICRLVISLFIVYPLSYIHRELVLKKDKVYQLIYFFISGIAVIYYVIGARGTAHCLTNILIVWVTKKLFGPTQTTVVITVSTTMVYLIAGYMLNTNVEVYDVLWTTPHSIHTMKLIGIIFDYRDGNTAPELLSDDQKQHAISDFSLLELLAFCCTYTGGLTGPQMSFSRFRAFAEKRLNYETDSSGKPDSTKPATKKLVVGTVFLAFYMFGGIFLNRETVLDPDFNNSNIAYRLFYISAYGQLALSKYIGCWTVMEGGCMLLGISYDPQQEEKWSAMSSVNIEGLFLGLNNKSFIDNFNITTKYWFIRYLFKRTRYLGKWRSMCCTYLFIILWHGVHPGYFMAFLFEIPVITAEKQALRVLKLCCGPYTEWTSTAQYVSAGLARSLRFVTLGYGIQPFILLTFTDTAQVYNGLYWGLHVLLGTWLLLYHFLLQHRLPANTTNGKATLVTCRNGSVTSRATAGSLTGAEKSGEEGKTGEEDKSKIS